MRIETLAAARPASVVQGDRYRVTVLTSRLIRVEYSGEGELHIGAYTVKLYDTAAGELTIDCETMDAYRGDENMNRLISCEKFPVLEAGSNAISWTGGITAVEITPRWWVL